jgi:hypothetical protein
MAFENETTVVSEQHSLVRTAGFLLLGAVLGVCITIGAEYGLLRGGVLETALQKYFLSTSLSKAPVSQANPQPGEIPSSIASSTIAVPKAYATQEYTNALNAAVSSIRAIVEQSAQIGALFLKIRAQVSGGNLNGTLDLILNAKVLLTQQQALVEQFGQHLTELGAANRATTDVVTKSLTTDLLIKGTTLQQDLQSYTTALNGLLSGSIPTTSQVAAVDTQAVRVEAEAQAFVSVADKLFTHFSEANTPAK